MKPGDKVLVIATDEQFKEFNMNDKKINNNLRKYESTISEELEKGKFIDEDNVEHSSFVLDSTFVIPAKYLKLANEKQKESIKKEKQNVTFQVNKNTKITVQEQEIDQEEETKEKQENIVENHEEEDAN